MGNWLHGINEILDKTQTPMHFFFRDDDAGWENTKLLRMLDRFAQHAIPIDLAVIPASVDKSLADELLSRWQDNPDILGLHQHGFSHTNHEPTGRKCEFGKSRTKHQQNADLTEGKAHLQAYFGVAIDPFFTPPWNRCTPETVACLEELDFTLLSRDITATKFESPRLRQVPIHIDWSRIIKQSPNPLVELGNTLSQNLAVNELTGIMLHHADMGNEELGPLTELIAMLSKHPHSQGVLLRNTLN